LQLIIVKILLAGFSMAKSAIAHSPQGAEINPLLFTWVLLNFAKILQFILIKKLYLVLM
jgi:hypothetical protein